MIKFTEEQKKIVTATYELYDKYGFEKNEIEAIIFRGASIYKILADKIYTLEARVTASNERIEKYFEDKDVLEMLKDYKQREEVQNAIEKIKLQIKDTDLLRDLDSVIIAIKNLDDIVNKYEGGFEAKKDDKTVEVIISKLSANYNSGIKTIVDEPIISDETFNKANIIFNK